MDGFGRTTSAGDRQRRISKVSLDTERLKHDVVGMATKAATSVTEAFQGARRQSKASGIVEKEVDAKKCHEDLDQLKQKRKQRKEGRKEEIKQFHESLRALEGLRYRRQGPIAALAVTSVLLGVLVNELCASTDYVSEVSEGMLDDIRAANGRACNDKAGDPIKVLVTLLTIVLMAATFKQWQLKAEIVIQRQQLEDWMYLPGGSLQRTAIPLATYLRLTCELIVCAIHPLPYVRGDWEFSVDGESRVFYRFESVTVAIMVLRLYHLWRWFYLMATWKFTNLEDSFVVNDVATVERMSESNSSIARTTFPLKVMMAIHPVRVICCVVATLFLAITYLVRITEGPAGQLHSGDWWDQMWVTITQGTTGYGGSPPWTQWGRLCAVLMMCLGPMTVSVMTAATTRSITLNQEEALVFRNMQHNTLKVAVMAAAARIVQFWWRQKQALRRMGVQSAARSTNIALAFLNAIAPRRVGSLKARHGLERMRVSSASADSGFVGVGAAGQLGMIREQSGRERLDTLESALSRQRSGTPRGRGVQSPTAAGHSNGEEGNGGPGARVPLPSGWPSTSSPEHTPRHQNVSRNSSNNLSIASQQTSNHSNASEHRRARRPSLMGSIPSALGLSGGSGESGVAVGRMRARLGHFTTLKHLVPFWEEDSSNKKVQLLRNFYVALEEYDRFLANNKAAMGGGAAGGSGVMADRGAVERTGREERSGSIGLASRMTTPPPLNAPVAWSSGSRGAGMKGSKRRVSESMVGGAEFSRLEGGSLGSRGVEDMDRWRSERKMRADIELVQGEVQELREGMRSMMAMLQRIEAAVCPHSSPLSDSTTRSFPAANGDGCHGAGPPRDKAAGAGVGWEHNGGSGRDRPVCGNGQHDRTERAREQNVLVLSPMSAQVHLERGKLAHREGHGEGGRDASGVKEERRVLRPPSLWMGQGSCSGNGAGRGSVVTADYVSSEEGRIENLAAGSSSGHATEAEHIVPDKWEERLMSSPSHAPLPPHAPADVLERAHVSLKPVISPVPRAMSNPPSELQADGAASDDRDET